MDGWGRPGGFGALASDLEAGDLVSSLLLSLSARSGWGRSLAARSVPVELARMSSAHLWNLAKALAGLSSPIPTPTGAAVLPRGVVVVSINRQHPG